MGLRGFAQETCVQGCTPASEFSPAGALSFGPQVICAATVEVRE